MDELQQNPQSQDTQNLGSPEVVPELQPPQARKPIWKKVMMMVIVLVLLFIAYGIYYVWPVLPGNLENTVKNDPGLSSGLQKGMMKERDAKRLSDVRQFSSYLDFYRKDHGRYPANLDMLTPVYFSTIPQAPLPADQPCSDTDNTYQYSPTISGDNYVLLFCLGEGGEYGYASGVHKLSPSGILPTPTSVQ